MKLESKKEELTCEICTEFEKILIDKCESIKEIFGGDSAETNMFLLETIIFFLGATLPSLINKKRAEAALNLFLLERLDIFYSQNDKNEENYVYH